VPAIRHPRPWRRDSVFGDGPRAPLDRNGRARFRFLIHAHRRARRLTRAGLDQRLGENGRCDPSQATLAADAACCARTVQRACGGYCQVNRLWRLDGCRARLTA
jgi:hypothetical protein